MFGCHLLLFLIYLIKHFKKLAIDNGIVVHVLWIASIRTSLNAYLIMDDLETDIGNQIPLWLFGFM